MQIVLIAHYYPPINSAGAKRAESLSKYFTSFGHEVTVLTTRKSRADGAFTESVPLGVRLIELNWAGREASSDKMVGDFEPRYSSAPSWMRRLKDRVMAVLGQIPDPRLPLAFAFLSPWFSKSAQEAIRKSDIVIGTTPPWPMILAAILCKFRFGARCILDYRDHFSECHEMPGGKVAKWLEKFIDRRLANAADHVVCISEPMSNYYRSFTPNVHTILNGYDSEIMDAALRARHILSDGMVRIRYMGNLSPGRIPHNVLRALIELRTMKPNLFQRLRFEIFGNSSLLHEVLLTVYPDILNAFSFFPPVHYFESLKKICEADYLLFSETSSKNTLSAQGILPTKLFEYIGSGRPVLGDISPDTLAGSLLLKSDDKHIVGDSSNVFLSAMLQATFYERIPDINSQMRASLSRQTQTLKYTELIRSKIEFK